VLESFEFARFVQAALSIAVAFTIGRIEEFAVKAVEALFFRKRRAAEAHLDRIIRTLSHAPSDAMIEDALIREAVAALELSAAAVYRRGHAAGAYVRLATSGAAAGAIPEHGAEDPLVAALRARDGVVDLEQLEDRRAASTTAKSVFALAVPMFANAALTGFVLYGAHADGAAIDSDEAAQLERLADAASLAFEQLEARQLRADNAQLRLKLDALGVRADRVPEQAPQGER
jgi:hypothetical protein